MWEWLVRVLLDGSAEGRVLSKWGCSMANLGGALSETTYNTSLGTNGCSYRDHVLVLAPVGDWMLRLHIMSLHIRLRDLIQCVLRV